MVLVRFARWRHCCPEYHLGQVGRRGRHALSSGGVKTQDKKSVPRLSTNISRSTLNWLYKDDSSLLSPMSNNINLSLIDNSLTLIWRFKYEPTNSMLVLDSKVEAKNLREFFRPQSNKQTNHCKYLPTTEYRPTKHQTSFFNYVITSEITNKHQKNQFLPIHPKLGPSPSRVPRNGSTT